MILPDWFITLGTVTLTVIMVLFLLLFSVGCLGVVFVCVRDFIGWIHRRRRG